MQIGNKSLVLDLMEWVDSRTRSYAEVMDAWRTSCPRLPVWEDALECGLVRCERNCSPELIVTLTPAGREFLRSERPRVARA